MTDNEWLFTDCRCGGVFELIDIEKNPRVGRHMKMLYTFKCNLCGEMYNRDETQHIFYKHDRLEHVIGDILSLKKPMEYDRALVRQKFKSIIKGVS